VTSATAVFGKPTLAKARATFPALLQKVLYFDAETKRILVFLTNQSEIPVLMVAMFYRLRWRSCSSVGQRPPPHQALLRSKPHCREDKNLDYHNFYLMVSILHKQLGLPEIVIVFLC
jgi:hypothetical protein